MNKKLANKISYYKSLKALKYPVAKPLFYDIFVRPFNREKALEISRRKPAKDIALRDFGLTVSKDA